MWSPNVWPGLHQFLTHTHTHTYRGIYVCVCVHPCMCVCVCVYTQLATPQFKKQPIQSLTTFADMTSWFVRNESTLSIIRSHFSVVSLEIICIPLSQISGSTNLCTDLIEIRKKYFEELFTVSKRQPRKCLTSWEKLAYSVKYELYK